MEFSNALLFFLLLLLTVERSPNILYRDMRHTYQATLAALNIGRALPKRVHETTGESFQKGALCDPGAFKPDHET